MVIVFYRWEIQKYSNDYKQLCKFVLDILSLPHANADCERVFSTINGVKTKFRNRLSTSTISGVLHSKQFIKTISNNNCVHFEPTKEMYKKMTHSMLFPKSTNEEDDTETIFNLFGNTF